MKFSVRDLVLIALFVAVIALLGFIYIPIPLVPITGQTMGVMLAGAILGARRGAWSLLVFIALVGAGLPLLAGGRGGMEVFVAPPAGYLYGFFLAAYVIGKLVESNWNNLTTGKVFLYNVIGGMLIIYTTGTLGLMFFAKKAALEAAWVNVAFIPGDLLKAYIAAKVAIAMKKAYPLIRR